MIGGWEAFEQLGRAVGWSLGSWFACETAGNIAVDVALGVVGFVAGTVWYAFSAEVALVSCAVVAAVSVLVFAGLERASFSLGYTGLVAAVGLIKPTEESKRHKAAKAFTHPAVLVAVVGTTVEDVSGYPSIPWFPVVMCWALAFWVSRTQFGAGPSPSAGPQDAMCVLLAVLGFVTGMAQFISSG